MNKEEIKKHVSKDLSVDLEDLVWSNKCINPTTIRKEDNRVVGDTGYFVEKHG